VSTQPVAINRQQQADELKLQLKRSARRSDALYISGAVLVAAGLGWIRLYLAPIALGAFCLVFPALELATSFVRSLRSSHAPRR
jgi:hypothetical protein